MNKLGGKGTFISKSEAVMLQAVAVMLMVWHHLFGFPDRIDVPYVLVLDRLFKIETYMSYFGRICIVVFAFTSGYGMRKKVVCSNQRQGILGGYKAILLQMLKFFSRYWVVFFLFVPIGYLLKVYSFDWKRFLVGIAGNAVGYNAEWWYVGTYIHMLLLFPVLSWLSDLIAKFLPLLHHALMATGVVTLLILPVSTPYYGLISILMCFVEGMYFVDSNIFEVFYCPLSRKPKLRLAVGLTLFGLVFILSFNGVRNFLLIALFIFAVVVLLKSITSSRVIRPVLMYIGKYSTYIWLTHTFFGYYYFQRLTFLPKYSLLVFLWCLLLSVATGMLLEWILNTINKGVNKIFTQKNRAAN